MQLINFRRLHFSRSLLSELNHDCTNMSSVNPLSLSHTYTNYFNVSESSFTYLVCFHSHRSDFFHDHSEVSPPKLLLFFYSVHAWYIRVPICQISLNRHHWANPKSDRQNISKPNFSFFFFFFFFFTLLYSSSFPKNNLFQSFNQCVKMIAYYSLA